MLVTLLHQFEFKYENGDYFFDRSGALTRNLQARFGHLSSKATEFLQREFTTNQDINLLFGIATSRIQSFDPADKDFAQRANVFLQEVTKTFELDTLVDFSYRQVVAKMCHTHEEAVNLLWPIVGTEIGARVPTAGMGTKWKSFQWEFTASELDFLNRAEVINLVPHHKLMLGEFVTAKIHELELPRLSFEKLPIRQALEQLQEAGKQADKSEESVERKGVKFVLRDEDKISDSLISLDLRNVPMIEALRYITELANLSYRQERDIIVVGERSQITAAVPHAAFEIQVTARAPVLVGNFDSVDFITNISDIHRKDLLAKFASAGIKHDHAESI